jgi:hypothetical protein
MRNIKWRTQKDKYTPNHLWDNWQLRYRYDDFHKLNILIVKGYE